MADFFGDSLSDSDSAMSFQGIVTDVEKCRRGQPVQPCTMQQALDELLPRPVDSFPRATQDGAGIYSYPDWSVPPPGVDDVFKPPRKQLHDFFLRCKAPARLRQAVCPKSAKIPCLQSQRLIRCALCGNSGLRMRAMQAPLIGSTVCH